MSVEFRDKTGEALMTMRNLAQSEMRDFVSTVVEIAKEEAPFDTGNLKRSINWDGPNGESPTYRVFTQTGYGGYVHEGTSRIAPNPFGQRAIDRALPEFNRSGPWS